jgi:hypothetical protein
MNAHCLRCGRSMKPTASGFGPKCEAKSRLQPPNNGELWFDLDRLESSAREQVREVIESSALRARVAIRHLVVEARERLGVW